MTYINAGGPPPFGSAGSAWQVQYIQLDINFGFSAIDSARISISDATADETIYMQAGVEAAPIGDVNSDGSFAAGGLQDFEGLFSGELGGRFLGTNADGGLMAFEIQEIEGERRIVGTQVLGVAGN